MLGYLGVAILYSTTSRHHQQAPCVKKINSNRYDSLNVQKYKTVNYIKIQNSE